MGDVCATIVSLNHPARVIRVDPEIVVVTVRDGILDERRAAIRGLPRRAVEDIDGVRLRRMGENMHVVPCTPAQITLLALALPRLPAVIRPEHRPVFRLNNRVDAIRLRGGNRDADLSKDTLRQSLVTCQLGPRLAAV